MSNRPFWSFCRRSVFWSFNWNVVFWSFNWNVVFWTFNRNVLFWTFSTCRVELWDLFNTQSLLSRILKDRFIISLGMPIQNSLLNSISLSKTIVYIG